MPSSTDRAITEGIEDMYLTDSSTDSSTVGGVTIKENMSPPEIPEPDELDEGSILDHYQSWNVRPPPDRQPFFDDDTVDESRFYAKTDSPNWSCARGGTSTLKLAPLTTDNLRSFFNSASGPKNKSPAPASDTSSIIDALQRIIDFEGQETERQEAERQEAERQEKISLLTQIVEESHVPVTITVFHLFHKLPESVRLEIWNLSCPDARLVELIERKKNCKFYGAAQRVANLYVCRESREETLKSYPLSFSVNCEDPLVPFNFEKDTLFLGRNLLDEHNHIFFRKHCDRGDLAKVQKLMVDTKLYWMTDQDKEKLNKKLKEDCGMPRGRNRGTGFGGLSRSVFSGVVEYTALYSEDTDPLPAWAKAQWYPRIPKYAFQRSATERWEDKYKALKNTWSRIQPLKDINDYGVYYPLTEVWKEKARYGGIDKEKKWDPAIIRWEMPSIACIGLRESVVDEFYQSEHAPWPFLLVDRCIGDLFE